MKKRRLRQKRRFCSEILIYLKSFLLYPNSCQMAMYTPLAGFLPSFSELLQGFCVFYILQIFCGIT